MYLQKLFLVAVLVGVCVAKCNDGIIGSIGSIPCKITPGFGAPGIGGGAGGFNGLASQYVRKLCTFCFGKEKKMNYGKH